MKKKRSCDRLFLIPAFITDRNISQCDEYILQLKMSFFRIYLNEFKDWLFLILSSIEFQMATTKWSGNIILILKWIICGFPYKSMGVRSVLY